MTPCERIGCGCWLQRNLRKTFRLLLAETPGTLDGIQNTRDKPMHTPRR